MLIMIFPCIPNLNNLPTANLFYLFKNLKSLKYIQELWNTLYLGTKIQVLVGPLVQKSGKCRIVGLVFAT